MTAQIPLHAFDGSDVEQRHYSTADDHNHSATIGDHSTAVMHDMDADGELLFDEENMRLELEGDMLRSADSGKAGGTRLHKMKHYGHLPLPARVAVYWWNSSSARERTLSLVTLASSLLLVIFFILFICASVAVKREQLTPTPITHVGDLSNSTAAPVSVGQLPPGAICDTAQCVMSASAILSRMDLAANPCDDFYEYTCGSWMKQHTVPDTKARLGQFDVLEDRVKGIMRDILESTSAVAKSANSSTNNTASANPISVFTRMKSLYSTCLNTTAVEEKGVLPMREYIHRIAAVFPTFESLVSKDDFTQVMIYLHKLGVHAFFSVQADADNHDPTKRVLHIAQDGLGLPSKEYYTDRPKGENYEMIMLDFFETILGDRDMDWERVNGYSYGGTRFIARVNEVMNLERQLAQASWDKTDLLDPGKTYNPVRLVDLQRDYPLVDWPVYLEAMLPSSPADAFANMTFVDVTPSYTASLMRILKQHRTETLRYYMIWHFLLHFTDRLSDDYRKPMHAYNKLVEGTNAFEPRWHECVTFSTQAMGFEAGRAYVEQEFGGDSKQRVTVVMDAVRESFKQRLMAAQWLDKDTRQKALEKYDTMKQLVGYPDSIFNASAIEQRYATLHVDPADYFKNAVNVQQYQVAYDLQRVFLPVEADEWQMFPQEVNAYYSPLANKIVLPAAVFQQPFYNPLMAPALNFGGIGSIVGHEITHGFDNQGRMFDGSGRMVPWWSSESAQQFDNATKCFVDQYAEFEAVGPTYKPDGQPVPDSAIKTNSKLTLGETLADNGGLQVAWDAWKKSTSQSAVGGKLPGMQQITDEALFFVGFAQNWCTVDRREQEVKQLLTDPHPTPRVRVNGAAMNFDQFARAFKCPPTSPMNPAKRCKLW